MAKDTKLRMLETTARLLQHRGYYGTSLNDILKESGSPRGSLYFHFPGGKDQLVLEATRAAVEEATQDLRECLASAETPAQGVRTFVEAAATALRKTDYTFGCPVAPVILDAAGDVTELSDLCRQAFEEWVGLLEESFIKGGMPEDRAYALALLVESSIEGLLLIARSYRNADLLLSVAAELEAVIEGMLQAQGEGKVAGDGGFEPPLPDPESGVLPLD